MKSDNSTCLQAFICLVITTLLLTGCTQKESYIFLQTAEVPCITKGWPHDRSNLKPDPALVFGTLENGLRYVIMQNDEPKDRVGLYLNIQAGSLGESDDQRGYAHFLEHMLFNGTTNYPPGTLVEYFQSIGMGFGSDTNAHTSYNETVYRLLLPDGTEKNLHDGLLVMADYARGALLLENEVERERGIILAERRTRDSANYRLYEKRTKFSYAGTQITERFPIGTEETLRKADADSLRSFYDSWYRPENMILVVVGDVDVDLAGKLVAERFNPLGTPAKNPECYDFGKVEEIGEHFLYVYEPEIGSTEITIGTSWNIIPVADSIERQQVEMKKYITVLLFQNRLKQLVRQTGSPFTKAHSYSGSFLERIGYATVSAKVEGEKWQEGFELLHTSLRQSIEHGFSLRELVRAKKEIMADLKKDVQTAASRDSRKLANNIIHTLNSNEVLLSPQQALELYGPVVESMSLSEANVIFKDMWSHNNRRVIVAGTAVIEGEKNPEETIRSVYEFSRLKQIDPWQENNEVAFPYLPVPEAVFSISDHDHFDAIDMDRFIYANGTVLNVKKTSFQPNEVLVEVHFGLGKSSEEIPGLTMLADAVINESGVGSLTRNQLEDALAGHNVNISFRTGAESFSLKGKGLSSELELMLQLIETRLYDPAFREDAYLLSMERFSQMYEQMSSSVDGAMQLQGAKFLAGDNPHYGMPAADQFKQLTLDQVKQWLAPVFDGAPLEISVVGDVDSAHVTDLVGRYFGTKNRQYENDNVIGSVEFPVGGSLHKSVVSQVDKALVVIAWPTDDFWDISRTRRLNILSRVFADRLRVEIREKRGAVYSPQVWNHSSRSQPGYGVLRAMLTVDPDKSEGIVAKVREVGSILSREGVTEAELTRSLEPSLTSIKDMKQTNRYWMESVLSLSSQHSEQLEWPLTIQDDFASITAKEISEFASRYLNPKVSAEIIFMPKTP